MTPTVKHRSWSLDEDRRLHALCSGDGAPIILLHGFTGGPDAWPEEAWRPLEEYGRVIRMTLPGHSPETPFPADSQLTMEGLCRDLIQVFEVEGWEAVQLVGYSMGGRVAIALATMIPHRIRSLVVESGSPGLATPRERDRRRAADGELASRIRTGGVESFVEDWMALPLFASQTQRVPQERLAKERLRRCSHSAEGLARALEDLGTGSQESYWSRLDRLTMPVLFLAGEDDTKFAGLARDMAHRVDQARVHVVPEAGHTVHLENPRAWTEAVGSFLTNPLR